MVYREGGDALSRARERLSAAEQVLDEARGRVEVISGELAHAQRQLELARLSAGAATAALRQAVALLSVPAAGVDRGELERERDLAQSRLEEARAQISASESQLDAVRAELRKARRALGVRDREHRALAREIERLVSP